jgi:hypothetical protein
MVGRRSLPSSDATKTEHNLIVISQGLDRLHSVSFRSSCAICPLKKKYFFSWMQPPILLSTGEWVDKDQFFAQSWKIEFQW